MCINLKLQKKVWRDKFITGDNKGERRTSINLREAVTQKDVPDCGYDNKSNKICFAAPTTSKKCQTVGTGA